MQSDSHKIPESVKDFFSWSGMTKETFADIFGKDVKIFLKSSNYLIQIIIEKFDNT